VDVGEFPVQQGQQVEVILGRYFLFEDLVPGFLRVCLTRNLKAALPVGEDVGLFEDLKMLFGRRDDR